MSCNSLDIPTAVSNSKLYSCILFISKYKAVESGLNVCGVFCAMQIKLRTVLLLQARGKADPHAVKSKMTSSCYNVERKKMVYTMCGLIDEVCVRYIMEMCFVCIFLGHRLSHWHHILGESQKTFLVLIYSLVCRHCRSWLESLCAIQSGVVVFSPLWLI